MVNFKEYVANIPTSLVHMVKPSPEDVVGGLVQYTYSTPMINSFCLMFLCTVVYYFFIKSNRNIWRYWIAYMRFFSESRDMSEALLFYYIGIYAVTMSYLIVPFHTFFRVGEDEDIEIHVMRYVQRLLRKKMSKKDLEVFLSFINQYQEYRADFINGEGWDSIKTWSYYDNGPTEDDDALETTMNCIDDSDFFWVTQYHNYFFFDKFLKDHMRETLYNCFPNKEVLKAGSDVDELVEIFFNRFVYSYAPAYAAWIPSVAVAGSDTVGWLYDTNDIHILNDLNKNTFTWEMYNKDIEPDEIDLGTSTVFSYRVFTMDELGYSPDGKNGLPKYPWKLYSRDMRYNEWKDAPFNDLMPTRTSVLNTILSNGKLMEKFFIFENWWNISFKFYRGLKHIATHPMGTDWAITTKRKPIYKKFEKKLWRSQINFLKGFEVLKFKDFHIAGRIDYMSESVRRPTWIKDRTLMHRPHLDCELTLFFWKYSAIPRPWRSIWRYFFIYRKENTYGWWASYTENELARQNIMRNLVNPFFRLRNYYYLMYGHLYNVAFRENYITRDFINDGENPYITGSKYLFLGWQLEPDNEDVFQAPFVFEEWSRAYQPDITHTVFNETTPFNEIFYGGKSFDALFDTYYFDLEVRINVLETLAKVYYQDPEMLVNDVRFMIAMLFFYLFYNYIIRLLVIKYIKKEVLNRYNVFPILQSFRNFKEFIFIMKKFFLFLIGLLAMGMVTTILGWQYRGLENPLDILFLEDASKKTRFKRPDNPIVLPREIGQKFFYKGSSNRRPSEFVWSEEHTEYLYKVCWYFSLLLVFLGAGVLTLYLGIFINEIIELPETQRVESFQALRKRIRKLHEVRLIEIYDSNCLERSQYLIKKRALSEIKALKLIVDVPLNLRAFARAINGGVHRYDNHLTDISEIFAKLLWHQAKCEEYLGHSIDQPLLNPREQRRAHRFLIAYNREIIGLMKELEFQTFYAQREFLRVMSNAENVVTWEGRYRRLSWLVSARVLKLYLDDYVAVRGLLKEEQKRVLNAMSKFKYGGWVAM